MSVSFQIVMAPLVVVLMCCVVDVSGVPAMHATAVRHDVSSHPDHTDSAKPSSTPSPPVVSGNSGGQEKPPPSTANPSATSSSGGGAAEGKPDASLTPSSTSAQSEASMPSFEADQSDDDLEDDYPDVQGEPVPSADEEDEGLSPDSGEVCVDARHLSRFPEHQLVHTGALAPIADVLCPIHATLPCGTPDHLLVVRGVATSYREVCSKSAVRCTRARMAVNSVLSHVWSDELHAGDIALTMFDARHATFLQRLLHRAIAFRRTIASITMS